MINEFRWKKKFEKFKSNQISKTALDCLWKTCYSKARCWATDCFVAEHTVRYLQKTSRKLRTNIYISAYTHSLAVYEDEEENKERKRNRRKTTQTATATTNTLRLNATHSLRNILFMYQKHGARIVFAFVIHLFIQPPISLCFSVLYAKELHAYCFISSLFAVLQILISLHFFIIHPQFLCDE